MDKAIERINCMGHLGKPESTGWKNVLTLLPSTIMVSITPPTVRDWTSEVFNTMKVMDRFSSGHEKTICALSSAG